MHDSLTTCRCVSVRTLHFCDFTTPTRELRTRLTFVSHWNFIAEWSSEYLRRTTWPSRINYLPVLGCRWELHVKTQKLSKYFFMCATMHFSLSSTQIFYFGSLSLPLPSSACTRPASLFDLGLVIHTRVWLRIVLDNDDRLLPSMPCRLEEIC